ncbi:SIMPL domain-containing protein [Sphaerisporangium sp. NPDC051017]|uniref:SIMPL domain-containing protein n=1 Tax=Sphaerisporangium sp. NPDC051017 TaxID=3154636 RepID=UPI00341FE87D
MTVLMMRVTGLSVVLAAAGVVFAGPQAAHASPGPADPTAPAVSAGEPAELGVVGRGSVRATPDVMRLSVGVEVRRDKAGAAFAAVKEGAARLTDALIAAGVARQDLRTNDLSLGTEYEKYPKVVGYRASQGVEALVRDLSKADAVIDAVAAAGDEVRLSGLSFEISRSHALLKEARAAAYRDARAKAEQYAALAGRQVGRVMKLEEEGDSAPPRFAMAEKASVSPGQGTITIIVRVIYELV